MRGLALAAMLLAYPAGAAEYLSPSQPDPYVPGTVPLGFDLSAWSYAAQGRDFGGNGQTVGSAEKPVQLAANRSDDGGGYGGGAGNLSGGSNPSGGVRLSPTEVSVARSLAACNCGGQSINGGSWGASMEGRGA